MAKKTKQKKPKRKLAIVMSGGGMRCAYGAGALLALAEKYNLREPHVLIAASGSAGTAAYYLAKQYQKIPVAWMTFSQDPHMLSFKQWPMFDVDYVVDTIFKKNHPIDLKALKKQKTKFLLPVTRVRDGATLYLRAQARVSIYEYLRAAKAMPGAYGKTVRIGNDAYVDGDFGANTIDFVKRAFQEGGNLVIAIESNPEGTRKIPKRLAMKALWLKNSAMKKKGLATAALREIAMQETLPKSLASYVITISPSKKLPVTFMKKKKLALRTAFNLGYSDAANNAELAKLLKKK